MKRKFAAYGIFIIKLLIVYRELESLIRFISGYYVCHALLLIDTVIVIVFMSDKIFTITF